MSGWVSFDDGDSDGPHLHSVSAPTAPAPLPQGGFASMFGAAPMQPPSHAGAHVQHPQTAPPRPTPAATASSNPFITFSRLAAAASPTSAQPTAGSGHTGGAGSKSYKLNPFADLPGSSSVPPAPQQLRPGLRPPPPIPSRQHRPAPAPAAAPTPVAGPAATSYVIQTRTFDAFAPASHQHPVSDGRDNRDISRAPGTGAGAEPSDLSAWPSSSNSTSGACWAANAAATHSPLSPRLEVFFSGGGATAAQDYSSAAPQATAMTPAASLASASAPPAVSSAADAAPAAAAQAAAWPTFDTLFADESQPSFANGKAQAQVAEGSTPQAASTLPPPPSYDSLFGSDAAPSAPASHAPAGTPHPSAMQSAAGAPPPSYDELFGASTASSNGVGASAAVNPTTLPPPSYDDLFGALPAASNRDPPASAPPSYDNLFGSGPHAGVSASVRPGATQPGWATSTAGAFASVDPPSYGSLFGVGSHPQPAVPRNARGPPGAPPTAPNVLLRADTAPPVSSAASPQDASTALAAYAVGRPAVGGAGTSAAGAEARDALCIELRLPPMKGAPKPSLAPRLLASVGGSLFLAPAGVEGVAALQWAGAAHAPCVPRGMARADFEDPDAAAAGALQLPDSVSSGVSAILTHEPSGMLWTAHQDRRICRWSLQAGSGAGHAPGTGAVLEQQWPAARVGTVRALAVTPWGDLWSGSENGSIRVWAYPGGNPGRRPPSRIRELKRAQGGKPYDKVHAIAVSSTGATVWTLGRHAGRTSVLIWHAHSLQCLGSVPLVGVALLAVTGLETDSDVPWIDPQKGLDPRLLERSVAARPLQPESAELLQGEGGDSAATIGMMAHKGVSKVSKLAAKFGRKVHTHANAAFGQVPMPAGYIPAGGSSLAAQSAPPAATTAPTGSSSSDTAPSKVKALVATQAGGFILSLKHGLIQQYTETGRLVRAVDLRCTATCLCMVGQAVWCGCIDGKIRVVAAAAGSSASEITRQWQAHLFPVLSLALVGGTVYSLATDGTVRGWPAAHPQPPLQAAWRDAVRASLRPHRVRVVTGTWNVNETRPRPEALSDWLAHLAISSSPGAADLVCLALQEVEIGTTSVAWDAAISVLNKGLQEKGTSHAQWWTAQLLNALGGSQHWERVALRQMSGMLLIVFCRTALRPYIGEVSTGSVACGVMGVAGNKGAVAIQLSLFRRRFVVLSSHFAAHQEKVDERNADYAKIARNMRFRHQQQQAPTIATAATHVDAEDDTKVAGSGPSGRDGSEPDSSVTGGVAFAGATTYGEALRDAELLVWAGDFNYRINQGYEHVLDCANKGASAQLLPLDQLRQEAAKGNIFHGLYEVPPTFPPTYKFDKGAPTVRGRPLPYDTSEKRRVPAWTDRILWRGSVPSMGPGAGPCPGATREEDVVALPHGEDPYSSCLEICDSDHKPVLLDLDVRVPGYIQEQKRRITLDLLSAAHQQELQHRAAAGGETAVAIQVHVKDAHVITALPHSLGIRGQVPLVQVDVGGHVDVHVLNVGTCVLVLRAAGVTAAAPWLPSWLEVMPASFVLEPGQARAVKLGAVRPDIMQSGTYPLNATVHFVPQPLGAYGPDVQQSAGSAAVVCVEVQ